MYSSSCVGPEMVTCVDLHKHQHSRDIELSITTAVVTFM